MSADFLCENGGHWGGGGGGDFLILEGILNLKWSTM